MSRGNSHRLQLDRIKILAPKPDKAHHDLVGLGSVLLQVFGDFARVQFYDTGNRHGLPHGNAVCSFIFSFPVRSASRRTLHRKNTPQISTSIFWTPLHICPSIGLLILPVVVEYSVTDQGLKNGHGGQDDSRLHKYTLFLCLLCFESLPLFV